MIVFFPLTARLDAAIRHYLSLQHAGGSFPEYSRTEHSLSATGFGLGYLAKTLRNLRQAGVADERRAQLNTALQKAMGWLLNPADGIWANTPLHRHRMGGDPPRRRGQAGPRLRPPPPLLLRRFLRHPADHHDAGRHRLPVAPVAGTIVLGLQSDAACWGTVAGNGPDAATSLAATYSWSGRTDPGAADVTIKYARVDQTARTDLTLTRDPDHLRLTGRPGVPVPLCPGNGGPAPTVGGLGWGCRRSALPGRRKGCRS